MDFLRAYVIGIDLDAGELSILKSVPESSGSQLKLSRDSVDRPILSVEISKDNEVWFVVDTGCMGRFAGTMLEGTFTDFVEQNHLNSVRDGVEVMKLSGPAIRHKARLDVFQVGSFKHTGLEFIDDDSDNLLGMGYLSRYAVTLDFQNDFMYLKEGKRFAEAVVSTDTRASAGNSLHR
jgi:hypothetical protein